MSPPPARETFTRAERAVSLAFRGGKAKDACVRETQGQAVRLIAEGRLGVATRSGAPSAEAAADLLERALQAAEAGEAAGFRFPGPEPPPPLPDMLFSAAVAALAPGDLKRIGRETLERVAAAAPDASVDLDLQARVLRTRLESTTGLAQEELTSTFSAFVTLSLVDGDDLIHVNAEASARSPEGVVEAAVARALAWLAPARRKVRLERMPARVVFAPEAVECLVDPLVTSLDGLEAALGGSPLAYSIGDEVMDARLTLRDDGTHAEGIASSRWDGDGLPRRDLELIARGELRAFFHDLRSAARAEAASTASAVRSELLPVRAPGNWLLESEERIPLAQLLRESGESLLVVELLGVGQSSGRDGAFTHPLALGFLVRGGELVGRVSDLVIAGNVYHVLHERLMRAGDDAVWTYGLGFPLKAPSLLVEGVSVSA